MKIDRERLLARFLKYVQVDTTADPRADRYPSSEGQRALGQLLLQELQSLGLEATQDEWGVVMATVPGNVSGKPVVALNSHLDTSPETSGKDVNPQVVEAYAGGDIPLGTSGITITVAENPELKELIGKTLITTDGTTLLGGDDKAGVAIIMQVAETLVEHPDLPHGDVRILFTCDEEIGKGTDHVDLQALGADVCYTLDGGGAGDVDVETFSADGATVTIEGINIHPSIAKDRMVNAVKAMAAFLELLPPEEAPETTADRQGFLHPYDVRGGVEKMVAEILLRDFDTANLTRQADRLRAMGDRVMQQFPGAQVTVDVEQQYRNLGDGLRKEPRAVTFAEQAHARLGMECRQAIIRGGTDGSQFTEKGLPTPNLSSGQHNPHSPREFACLDEMVSAAEVAVELLGIWAE